MIFGKPDYSEFVKQQRVYDFRQLNFNQNLDQIFKDNADWSVVLLGKLKYASICDTPISNRAAEPAKVPIGTTEVKFTIETDLEMETFLDRRRVAWSSTGD